MKAKQTVSNLTEAEAIEQARRATPPLSNSFTRRIAGASTALPTHDQESRSRRFDSTAFLQLFRKIGTFRGEPFFNLAASSDVNIVSDAYTPHKPAEFPVEDLERYSSNGEGPFETGSSDTSMLGAIDRLNLMRAIRIAGRYKKLFLMHDVIGYEHARSRGSWMLDWLLQVAGAQGSQKTSAIITGRT